MPTWFVTKYKTRQITANNIESDGQFCTKNKTKARKRLM